MRPERIVYQNMRHSRDAFDDCLFLHRIEAHCSIEGAFKVLVFVKAIQRPDPSPTSSNGPQKAG